MRLRNLLAAGAALRIALIVFGEAQDALSDVKYTDVDYAVFTDAARFVAAGGSPYERATYRYSPIIAWLMLPNVLLSRLWGKLLFSAADLLVAAQLADIGRVCGAPPARCAAAAGVWLFNPYTATISTRGSCDALVTVLLLVVLQALLTRRAVLAGTLYGLAVHLRLYPVIYAPAALLHLAATAQQHAENTGQQQMQHAENTGQQQKQQKQHKRAGVCRASAIAWVIRVMRCALMFGAPAAAVFVLLGAICWKMYGHIFLQEAFLHHLSRVDPRHSFSPYYYPAYLGFMPWGSTAGFSGSAPASFSSTVAAAPAGRSELTSHAASVGEAWVVGPDTQGSGGLLLHLLRLLPPIDVGRGAFAAQGAVLLALAAGLHTELPLCWLVQTLAFVALNKVCTAQYFVWFFSLLPLALLRAPWPPPNELVVAAAAWVVTQLHWLAWGYALEFQGAGAHLGLWFAGVIFLVANAGLIAALMRCCCATPAAAAAPMPNACRG